LAKVQAILFLHESHFPHPFIGTSKTKRAVPGRANHWNGSTLDPETQG
jgi:hypothetical protein